MQPKRSPFASVEAQGLLFGLFCHETMDSLKKRWAYEEKAVLQSIFSGHGQPVPG